MRPNFHLHPSIVPLFLNLVASDDLIASTDSLCKLMVDPSRDLGAFAASYFSKIHDI